jgi:hypothetical protein
MPGSAYLSIFFGSSLNSIRNCAYLTNVFYIGLRLTPIHETLDLVERSE